MFIKTFAPTSDWEQVVPHPNQDLEDSMQEYKRDGEVSYLVEKHWSEKYPADLAPEEIDTIISDSYKHRSCFIHRGKQPPHQLPTRNNRFFQEHLDYDGNLLIQRLLPNYELLVGIAQLSIRNWMTTIK